MTDKQIIRQAICTAKELKMDARILSVRCGQSDPAVRALKDGAASIEALVGLLRQKKTAPGDSSTESG